jgi:3-deoxy-D-manno-octulosonate 8-phosphate phosphatase (KDO 8-P phosphatase)
VETEIKAIALDVDGVLTDGTFWWGAGGEEFKRFSFLDIMGVSLGRKAGLVFALISGEDSPLVDRYAAKMGIAAADVFKGCKDKGTALRAFAARHGLALEEVGFMGNDVNDRPALELAGLPAVPADAHETARRVAAFVATRSGGDGAVRELVDLVLARRGTHEPAAQKKEGPG